MDKPKLYQIDSNKYIFIFPDGQKSKTFSFADEFVGNMAVVSDSEFGGFKYLNTKNQLSETYEQAFSYSCGFGLVQKTPKSGIQFRDRNGKLSEEFFSATEYKDGYAKVKQKKNGPVFFRDVLGHLTKSKTLLGDLAYDFCNFEINTTELPDICFTDPQFFKMIKYRAYVDACFEAGVGVRDQDEYRDDLYTDNLQYIYDRMFRAGVEFGQIQYPNSD